MLIIKPSSLGDIVHGLQVAQSLRAQWPAAEVDWVAAEPFAPLVRECAAVARVQVFRRRGPLRDFARLAGEIRETRYDWALDFQGLARSALLLAAARAVRKAARADAREGARWLCRTHAARPPDPHRAHALDILLQFLPLLGLRAAAPGPLRFRTPEVAPFPPELLLRGPVVIFPDSRRPEKQWGHFFALTHRLLARRPDLPVVWAGQDGPEPEMTWPEGRFWNLIGRTEISALPQLLSAARLVISNDSGPMHLAAALHRPVVALFGPTSPERFGPWPLGAPRHYVVRAPGGDLARLEVDEVFEAALAALR